MKRILFFAIASILSVGVSHAQMDAEQLADLKSQIKAELKQELKSEQEKSSSSIKLKAYGFVRNDFCYDTRECVTAMGETFHIIPKDQLLNADGSEDLNDVDRFTLVAFVTRFGVDITGPKIGRAEGTAKIEADFCGYTENNTLFRIRQAYVALGWERTTLIFGQTWHPMVNQVMPAVYGLGTGSPFASFNRSPQVKVMVDAGKGWNFTAAALYQFPNLSVGPDGASYNYSRWSRIPELYASWKHVGKHFTYGVGVDFLSLMPRKISFAEREVTLSDGTIGTQAVEVRAKDRVSGLSSEFFADYVNGKFNLKGKLMYAENTAHLTMVSGFGATSYDPLTGSYEYAPVRSTTSWITATYGKQLKPGLMLGYMNNLGAKRDFISVDDFWMRGAKNVDYIYRISPSVSYTVKNLLLALEIEHTVVGYGDLSLNGASKALRDVGNTRACLMVKYSF